MRRVLNALCYLISFLQSCSGRQSRENWTRTQRVSSFFRLWPVPRPPFHVPRTNPTPFPTCSILARPPTPVLRTNQTPFPTCSTVHWTCVREHCFRSCLGSSMWTIGEKALIMFCLIVGNGIIWMDNVNCFGYETSLTQCRQVGWGLGNCDPLHREDAGVVCDNTTVEEVSNNYCRRLNNGSCKDLKVAAYTWMLIFIQYIPWGLFTRREGYPS